MPAMDITRWSATEIALAVRSGRISAKEVVESHLARIDRVNPAVNAIVRLDAHGALRRAATLDAALARGQTWGPLHGVPFTLKDMHGAEGMPGSLGSRASERVASEDGLIAERLKKAGAILLGKTNMSNGVQTSSEQFGRSSNPYDLTRTPGGSSGGSAAAVASFLSAFDVGTDLSGSIRMPAHFTGIFGLRPTTHRIPLAGMIHAPPGVPRIDRVFSAAGPMARTAGDLNLLFRVLAGADPRDPDVPPVPVQGEQTSELRGLRIAIAPSIAGIRITREISGALEKLAARLADRGARVETREPIPFEELLAAFRRLFRVVVGSMSRARTSSGHGPSLHDAVVAFDERDRFIIALQRFFANCDVFIGPAAICTAFPHGPPGSAVDVDGESSPSICIDHPTILSTYTGAPSLVVPIAQGAHGLPIGAQLVAPRFRDERLLAIGAAVAEVVEPLPAPKLGGAYAEELTA